MNLHKPAKEENIYAQFGYGSQKNFNHTQGQVLGSMNTDPVDAINTIQKSTKWVLYEELKDSVYQEKQYIYVSKYELLTVNLTKTSHKPEGEEYLYAKFEYVPQKIWNHAQGQF